MYAQKGNLGTKSTLEDLDPYQKAAISALLFDILVVAWRRSGRIFDSYSLSHCHTIGSSPDFRPQASESTRNIPPIGPTSAIYYLLALHPSGMPLHVLAPLQHLSTIEVHEGLLPTK